MYVAAIPRVTISAFNATSLSWKNPTVDMNASPSFSAAPTAFSSAPPSCCPNRSAAGPISSSFVVIRVNRSGIFSNTPPSSDAPRRDRAACTFFIAPENVSPDLSAAPPMPFSMAAANVAKSIFPLDTISDTSAEVRPR